MRRKSNEMSLKEAIEKLMAHYHIEDRYRFEQVKNKWEEVVGKMIAQRTERMSLKNGTLYITLNSSTLRQELSFMKTDLIRRVNEEAAKEIVKEIVFR